MKVSLIFSPFVTNLLIPPLAPALLKGCLEKENIPTTTFDFNLWFQQEFHDDNLQNLIAWMTTPDYQLSVELFALYQNFVLHCVNSVINSEPDVVGVSVFSHESQRFAEDFCYHLRRLKPGIHIMLGGSGVTVVQNYYNKTWSAVIIDSGLADSACHGEGELVLVDLIRNRHRGIFVSPQIDNEEMLDVPVPKFDNYELDRYGPRDQLQLPITATKGCVRKCTFCDVGKIWPKFRYRKGASVANEMITIYENHGIRNFAFTDSLMNGGLKPFREMNQELSTRLPNTIHYSGQFICRDQDSMPPEDFKLMQEGGCRLVSIGIEAGSERVRNHMKKGFSDADLDYTATQLLNNGITQWWNIIVGYPTETDEDWQSTIDLIHRYSKHSDLVKITPVGVFQLLSGTPITTNGMLDELEIENHISYGYSEYNWSSRLNPGNNLRSRVERWIELVDLLKKYNMLSFSKQRLDQKTQVMLQQLKYYESKPNRAVFEIRQQSFQEPANFVN